MNYYLARMKLRGGPSYKEKGERLRDDKLSNNKNVCKTLLSKRESAKKTRKVLMAMIIENIKQESYAHTYG